MSFLVKLSDLNWHFRLLRSYLMSSSFTEDRRRPVDRRKLTFWNIKGYSKSFLGEAMVTRHKFDITRTGRYESYGMILYFYETENLCNTIIQKNVSNSKLELKIYYKLEYDLFEQSYKNSLKLYSFCCNIFYGALCWSPKWRTMARDLSKMIYCKNISLCWSKWIGTTITR